MNKILDNQVNQAKNTDMVEFLSKTYGYTFKSVGGGYKVNFCEAKREGALGYRAKEHESLCVGADRKQWFWHSADAGGFGAIDFLMKIEGYTFVSAVETILNCSFIQQAPMYNPPSTIKNLQLPENAPNHQKLWWYLCEVRKLDPTIIGQLERDKLIYQDVRGNVVFVGMNQENAPGHPLLPNGNSPCVSKFADLIFLRGTYPEKPYRKDCNGSDKSYGFHKVNFCEAKRGGALGCMTYEQSPKTLFVFESPIDCISHGSLVNLANNDPCAYFSQARLSLGGVSSKALEGYLERFSQVKEIVFCLDNDVAGKRASFELADTFRKKGYFTEVMSPQSKDYNEELVNYLNQGKVI